MLLVKCKYCEMVIAEFPTTLQEKRLECPSCGSKSRLFEVKITDAVTTYDKLRSRAWHGVIGKPFYEAVSGHDLHLKTGRWMHLDRSIDRDKNYYNEVVSDPESGEIIRKCEEPLSQHRGHGSAKQGKSRK